MVFHSGSGFGGPLLIVCLESNNGYFKPWKIKKNRLEAFTSRSSPKNELKQLIHDYEHLFPDIPSRTDKIYRDVDVKDSQPVKQYPCTIQKYLREVIQYLLESDFIEPSQRELSSPCILVPKPDGSYRMWTDYRKVAEI